MKTYQKVLCCVLAICIFFMCWARPAAHAEALTITGAAVMSIAVVACIVIMVMSSMDVIDALKDMAASKSMLPSQLVQQYIILFLSKTAVSVGQLLNTFKDGVRYKSDGTIYLSETVSTWVQQFIEWIWSSSGGGMQEFAGATGALTQINPLTINGVGYFLTSPVYAYTEISATGKMQNSIKVFTVYSTSSTTKLFLKQVNNTTYVVDMLDLNPFDYYSFNSVGDSTQGSSSRYQAISNYPYYYYGSTYIYTNNFTNFEFIGNYQTSTYTVNQSMPGVNNISLSQTLLVYGDFTADDADINTGILDLPEGKDTNVLEPQETLVLPAPIGLNIDEYLTGTVDVILEGTGEFTGTDDQTVTVEGTDTAVPVDQTTYGTLTGTETIAITTTLSSTEAMSIDLTSYFPFCIPFDIYKMLSLFAANRAAPVINWRFYIPNVCDETIVLDFSAFDQLAAILRHLELIAFAIGLAAATKKLIQGGD